MPDRLRLTKNAQFFLANENVNDEIIESILNKASDNIIPDENLIVDIFREKRNIEGSELNYVFSTKVYPSNRSVYFLDDDYLDIIHAFIIIIETGNYIAVLKKSCANISDILDQYFSLVESKQFSGIFSDNEVEFQKLALRNMTVSDRALRSRSYEAASLKGLLSTHSAGRSIPYYFKVRQGAVTKSISGTGRMVESSDRVQINDIATWVNEQLQLIQAPVNANFLDAFASKIELNEVMDICKPNAILVECTSLFERIQKDQLPIKYKTTSGKIIRLSNRALQKLESALEKVYEIDDNFNIVDSDGYSKIRVNKKTLTLQSKILSKVRLVENGKLLTLQKFIIKNGFYSITFNDPKFMYFMRACFQDNSGISEIDSILDILIPIKEMTETKSEKGTFSSKSKNFKTNSVFGLVENIHKQDNYIFCDDLGDEWADHITFNNQKFNISFIHSKYGVSSTSASNLHDVVGQGIKNLGNMYFNTETMMKKVENKFRLEYKSSDGVITAIRRIRKGRYAGVEKYLSTLLKDHKLNRSCILCCSFLSKSEIEIEFNKIKNGKPVRGNITQLLWIISSFAHATKDMNVRPIIYCAK